MHLQGSVIVESILASAVSDADVVLEAVVEDVQVKNRLFKGRLVGYMSCEWKSSLHCEIIALCMNLQTLLHCVQKRLCSLVIL